MEPGDTTSLRKALFSPRSVALVGASSDETKTTARPLRYLRKHGYDGRIVPINPGRATIGGLEAYPSLRDAPDGIDHAFLMCSTKDVLDAVRQCGERGITCATILSEGFAEAGIEGERRQRLVAEEARHWGVRLLGPNSIGIIDTGGFTCTANAALEIDKLQRGGYAVISQSGSMIGALLSQGAARGIGFSSLVSIGNEIDLTIGEIGELLLDDIRCEAILLFLESIKDRAALAAFARKAQELGKPVLAYKLGRSAAGRELAATHTGALAGEDDVVDALFAHLGIARVRILESLIEAPPLFLGTKSSTNKRVGVVTTTGGGGAMVVDCLGALNVDIAVAPQAVRDSLVAASISCGESGLIDLTLAGTRPEIVRSVIEGLMASPDIDAVAVVIGSSAQFHPDLAVAPLMGFVRTRKPLAVYLVPAADESRLRLTQAGIAVFRTPESCAESLHAYLRRRPPRIVTRQDKALAARVDALVSAAPAEVLDEIRAREVLSALGIPGPEGHLVHDPDSCSKAFDELGGRAVAKIVSSDILHKSDIGGVVLGIETGEEAREAFDALIRKTTAAEPQARIEGVLIQRMEDGVAEAILGFRREPSLGPVIMLGAGGIFAEIYRDTSLRVAPVDRETALEMISEVAGLKAAGGYRNRPLGDLDSLADAVVAMSQLANCDSVAEAEINPLLIRTSGNGVSALDALVLRSTTREQS